MFGTPRFDLPETDSKQQEASAAGNNGKTSVSSRLSKTAPAARRQRGRGRFLLLALAFLATLGTGFLGGYLGSSTRNASTVSGGDISRQREIAAGEGQLISAIAQEVGPSVVSINVTAESRAGSDFFGLPVQGRQQSAAGTGIIISSEGVIITNRHVVAEGITDVNVTLSDGTELDDVSVLGRTNPNDSLDIAFLKINDLEGKRLRPAEIGDSSKMQVGNTVVAIGNALGQFNNTVTSGIISGFGRSVVASSGAGSADSESLNDLIQTDAAINQGNSGGPLVNMEGQVIGVNTAVAGEGQNIGFAIPINDVNGLIKQVLSSGTFKRPYLGVRYVPLTDQAAEQYDLDVNRGAYVLPTVDNGQPSVLQDSPADRAGVKPGDVITAVDGTKIDERNGLTSLVGRHAVGETVKLTVLRDGRTLDLQARLVAMPSAQNTDNS
ncbi:MAG TPA: trypsin-like peptidase domain-containing protein [Candidatus Saccharimonadales bacterium]|nr:trypsin-like peptidase domain-containing protein [Candidatus Saccharimonadales bacterium]